MEKEKKNRTGRIGWILFLHLALLIYSTCSIFSKMASRQEFMSVKFILFYGGVIFVLGVYAVLWQQVIKHMPVTTAYANKAVTIGWGILLGHFVFGESVSPGQIAAALMIVAGAVLYVIADGEAEEK
jgi:drug/metabolite transporter (DMT)-like permease